jgi:pimeloyl-ACP methyl ester carboxylesterase
MDLTRWQTTRRLSALALLTAAWTGAAAQGAPRTGPGEGWVPLPSGGRLSYTVAGTTGDTVVVPGAVFWTAALAPLAREHTVIFYDLLGRGRSDSAAASRIALDSIVADLETLRGFFRLEKMGLVGLSVNGLVAAAYAAAHPARVARLALVSPIAPTQESQSAYNPPERATRTDSAALREMARLRQAGGSREAICRQFWKASKGWFVGDPATRIDAAWCAVPNETSDAALMWLGYLGSASGFWDLTAAARAVTAPTLVLHGARDYWANPEGARAWATAIPGARLLTLAGVGHLAPLESPDLVNAALADFFAGRWPPGAEALPH